MIQTEYVRSLNCNYERILLDKKPDEKRYQYCILSRGGIRGLLPCSLRYINGQAYLYYDISSRQNVSQLYSDRYITREWIRDFAWSLQQIQQELGRFLLDAGNILWYPEHVFQDLESNVFSFLYVPYLEGENSFIKLIEFWVEHIDYDDEMLVDCVYHMYEQMERGGETYLQVCFFEDVKKLEKEVQESLHVASQEAHEDAVERVSENGREAPRYFGADRTEGLDKTEKWGRGDKPERVENTEGAGKADSAEKQKKANRAEKAEKKGIRSIFEGKKNREKKLREDYRQAMQYSMAGYTGYAVAEESTYGEEKSYGSETSSEAARAQKTSRGKNTPYGKKMQRNELPYGRDRFGGNSFSYGKDGDYGREPGVDCERACGEESDYDQESVYEQESVYDEEEYGRTIYIEESQEDRSHRLYTPEGRLLAKLEGSALSIGKKKGEVDLALEDASVSRIHARITVEKNEAYLEDLNATNGTFKNGLRLQPYEKRKLAEGDEIKCGKVIFVFR